jgi:RNA recognition motif-containing protein
LEEKMNKRLYIGGLAYSVTEDQLLEHVTAYGTVESVNIVTDKFTDDSRGFGFVEMSTPEEAKAAIDGLNGTEFEGRVLTVDFARPRGEKPRRGGGGGGGRDRW